MGLYIGYPLFFSESVYLSLLYSLFDICYVKQTKVNTLLEKERNDLHMSP